MPGAGRYPDSVGVDVIRTHAAGLAALGRRHDLTTPVPTCGDWDLADLLWHLAEVHDLWHHVIVHRPAGPDDYEQPDRPPVTELADLLDDRCAALTVVLAAADPAERAWSWADEQTVGFTLRRQSHEALIHHLDGLLAVGARVPDVAPALAADGVDELIDVMLTGVPDWADYERTAGTVLLRATDTADEWALAYGRMTGTSPHTGTTYDLVAMEVLPEVTDPDTEIAGAAFELDRWLWGRGGAVTVRGNRADPDRLRSVIVESTA
jgi:hypothetical protein